MTNNLPAAKALIHAGYSIFPLVEGGGTPATANGFYDACDHEGILPAWRRNPALNIGAPTGRRQGLIVLDIDRKHGNDGLHQIEVLSELLGELPPTLTAMTPSNGFHYFFQYPKIDQHLYVKTIPARVGDARTPGLDVKGDGGYVVLPPSRKAHGRYRWTDTREPAPLPRAWLKELVFLKPSLSNVRHVVRDLADAARVATEERIQREINRLLCAQQGEIRIAAWKAATNLLELVNAGFATEADVFTVWESAARTVLKTDKEVAEKWREAVRSVGNRTPDPQYLPRPMRESLAEVSS